VKGQSQDDYYGLVRKGVDVTLDTSWYIYGNGISDGVNFVVSDGSTSSGSGYTSSIVLDNQWHHIVAVWDANGDGKSRLYVDGQLDSTAPTAMTTNIQDTTIPIQIGRYNSANRFFEGLIDEVRIYNKALQQSEIEVIYNTEKP
jgi:hypothetical protein